MPVYTMLLEIEEYQRHQEKDDINTNAIYVHFNVHGSFMVFDTKTFIMPTFVEYVVRSV